MKRRVASAVLALPLAACHAPLRSVPVPAPTAAATVDEWAAAIAADAQRSEHEPDAKIRDQLSADAARDSSACLQQAPQAAACLYYQAVALGLEARAHPARALELLKTMLDALSKAQAVDPLYDAAGPERVRALVLLRAPGWPLGPGDTEAGLAAARSAVSLAPRHPPNLLALAEALRKTGDAAGARDAYQQAQTLAQALPPTHERDDWLRQADQALSGN